MKARPIIKFDMIIGYTATKNELKQISGSLRNCDAYNKFGVSALRAISVITTATTKVVAEFF